MDLQLQGKTGLVTGASVGLGREIARELASEGVQLMITARREHLLRELSDEVEAAGGPRPIILGRDLMEDGAPEWVADAALSELGSVDLLINNAGAGGHLGILSEEWKWEAMMKLNFTVHRQITARIMPSMIEHSFGRVIVTGAGGNPAKAALQRFIINLAWEVSLHGVTANCVKPGKIMSEQVEYQYSSELRDQLASSDIAVGRFGGPEDVAHMVSYLCSPLAGYITGAVMPVDGGFLLRGSHIRPGTIGVQLAWSETTDAKA